MTAITSLQQISDLGFTPAKGKTPATGDKPLTILYRNGWVSKTPHKAEAIRWSIEQHAWDAVGYRAGGASNVQ